VPLSNAWFLILMMNFLSILATGMASRGFR
jgi:hypothetical protein